MRKNKKNWEIFSKSEKNMEIVYDHIPTTPALITTTHKGKEIAKLLKKETVKIKRPFYYSYIFQNKEFKNKMDTFKIGAISKDKIVEVYIHRGNKEEIEKLIKFSTPYINQIIFYYNYNYRNLENPSEEMDEKWLEETINKYKVAQ